jgi:uncharacterized membrane protein
VVGNYVLHYPLTDFAVSLLALAALVDVTCRLFARPQWQIAVDCLLFAGFAGAVAAVGSGLWLVAVQPHSHGNTLSLHHYFAYGTLGAATVAVVARAFQGRIPKLGLLRTAALLIAALLVSCAGYVGGTMAHPPRGSHTHTHDDEMDHDPEGKMPDMQPTRDAAPTSLDTSGSASPAAEGSGSQGAAPSTPPKSHDVHDGHEHSH